MTIKPLMLCWLLLQVGCASYRPLPLPAQVQPAPSLSELQGSQHVTRPLSMAAVDYLVLRNDPELRGARAQHKQAQAQMLQAGLLPNPVFTGNVGYLMSGIGDATGWTAQITEDVRALITLKPRREAAKGAAEQIDASLLWQEWQTLTLAHQYYVDIVQGEQRLRQLRANVAMLEQRDQHLRQSLRMGDDELSAMAPLLAATADAQTALNEAAQTLQSSRQGLNALLGLTATAALPLADSLNLPPLDTTQARAELALLERRRPDLVALQLGYQSQEAALRAAVLTQFPAFSLGYQGMQDNTPVVSAGPAVTLELPVFDHQQAVIASATATRAQLRHEYIARVTAAKGELGGLLANYAQIDQQLAELAPRRVAADQAAAAATEAYRQRVLDQRALVELASTDLSRRAAQIALEQQRLHVLVTIDGLLGHGMPTSLPQDIIQP